MAESTSSLSWKWIGLLVGVCVVALGLSLYVALRPSNEKPATGAQPPLVLKGKLSTKIAWSDLPVTVEWDGTKAGDIPKDLQAVYRGQTLYKVIGLVDDEDPDTFNVALARKGYSIKYWATDGYTWTMKSQAIIGQDGWILARLKNGKTLPESEGPYRDVGSFIKHFYGRESVKLLRRITLEF